MKRMMIRIAVSATIASLLLFASLSRGIRSESFARHMPSTGCSVASVRGSYGFYRTGTTPFGPLASVGIATFDGTIFHRASNHTPERSHHFRSLHHQSVRYLRSRFRLCRQRLSSGCSVFVHFVIVDHGKELIILSLSDANTIHGMMKKIDRDD